MRVQPRSVSIALLLGTSTLAGLAAPARAAAPQTFWGYWGDGKAELDGYALTEPRYGQQRHGTAVMIFVTEDFSDSARVKADPGKHPAADVYPVLKLNFVRDFQTGIYDYSLLGSVFARVADGFPWVKTSFSSREWCGHVYQQWLARADNKTMEGALHSYFDGEADAAPTLPLPDGGVLEDTLPILLRGLRGDYLPAGGSRTVPLLPSSMRARFEHKPQMWGEATIRRAGSTSVVASALGKVEAVSYVVEEKGGPTVSWTIEAAAPHRILAWHSTSGEAGTLLGSTRLPYWALHDEGGEKLLKQLGLPVPGSGSVGGGAGRVVHH